MHISLVLLMAMAIVAVSDLRLAVIPKNYPGYKPDISYFGPNQESGIYWALFYEHEPKVISSRETGLVHIYKLSRDEKSGWTIYAVDENGLLYQKFRAVKDSLVGNSQPIGVIFKEITGFRSGSTRYIVMDFFSLSSAREKVDTTGLPALKN